MEHIKALAQILSCAWLLAAGAFSAEPSKPSPPPEGKTPAGLYQIGLVQVDAAARRLLIPAQVNLTAEPIEYLLVSELGKLHESIFKTSAEPAQIHAAALLLLPPVEKTSATNPPPSVRIYFKAHDPGGAPKELPADSAILDLTTQQPLPAGSWQYLGSRMADGVFLAQRDGSIISIIADPDALMQTGRVARENDENWRPHKANLPEAGARVTIIIEFNPDSSESQKP